MIALELEEYGSISRVDLDPVQLAALRAHKALTVSPSPDNDGTWDLRAAQYVGAVVAPGIEVRIRPKLPVPRLLFLLAYAADPKGWQSTVAAFREETDLVTAIAFGFAHHAEAAIAQGVLQGYRVTEEALPALRGRLRESDQMRRRFGMPLPLEVVYDDYTVDIVENRMLRTAAKRLLHLPRLPLAVARRLRALDARLDDVELLPAGRAIPTVAFTRLNDRYRPAIRLAELILRSQSFDISAGARSSTTFIFDMNKVFEDFLAATILPALARHGGVAKSQHTDYLDQGGAITIRPDLTWWIGGRCRVVADAKYKRLAIAELPNADVYQMLAYCTALGVPRGYLIYPAGEAMRSRHRIRRSGVDVVVDCVDLNSAPEALLGQVETVATRWAHATSAPQRVAS